MQRLDAVARRRDHAFDEVVFTFGDGQFEPVFAKDGARLGGNRRRLVVKLHASKQGRALRRIERVLDRRLIDLGHLLLRRGVGVDELTVVGKEQQPGGVGVESADRLYTARRQLRRQQAMHTGVMRRAQRALVIRRLVQHQIGARAVFPGHTIDRVG